MKKILFSIMCIPLMIAVIARAEVSDKSINLNQNPENGNLIPSDKDEKLIKALLEKAADTERLCVAARSGDTKLVKALIEKGADVNAKASTNGATVLMTAVENGYTDVVKVLVEKGADVNVKVPTYNNNGEIIYYWTALTLAKKHSHADIVAILENAGAKE